MTHRKPAVWRILKAVVGRIGPDNLSLASAGVAFYALLAVFPALSLLLSIYGLVADPEDVTRQLEEYSAALPAEAFEILTEQLSEVAGGGGGTLTVSAILSFWFSLWSATRGTTALIQGLNIAFGRPEERNIIKKLAVSMGLTVVSVIGLSALFGLVAVLPGVWAASGLPSEWLPMAWARWPALLLGIATYAGMLYRLGPSGRKRRARFLTTGALLAAVLQLSASAGFSWYVSSFGSYNETYGSVGAIVVLMLWLYLSAFTLLVGAEVDAELSGCRDTDPDPPKPLEAE